MTSTYRRDHATRAFNDEFLMLKPSAQSDITAAVTSFESLYPSPVSSSSEKLALKRAFARFLIDSGKASQSGVLA